MINQILEYVPGLNRMSTGRDILVAFLLGILVGLSFNLYFTFQAGRQIGRLEQKMSQRVTLQPTPAKKNYGRSVPGEQIVDSVGLEDIGDAPLWLIKLMRLAGDIEHDVVEGA